MTVEKVHGVAVAGDEGTNSSQHVTCHLSDIIYRNLMCLIFLHGSNYDAPYLHYLLGSETIPKSILFISAGPHIIFNRFVGNNWVYGGICSFVRARAALGAHERAAIGSRGGG